MKSSAIALVVLAGCAHAARPTAARRLGEAMIEVGLRFERAGKAVLAGRWQLASYDVTELDEVFEDDLPATAWMARPEVARSARAFDATALPALRDAVQARDVAASEQAFERVARACNACHVAAGMGFIEVPGALGTAVPAVSRR